MYKWKMCVAQAVRIVEIWNLLFENGTIKSNDSACVKRAIEFNEQRESDSLQMSINFMLIKTHCSYELCRILTSPYFCVCVWLEIVGLVNKS